MVLANPSPCLHLPRGGLRSTVSSFPTSPSLYFICLLDLHMSGFYLSTFSNSGLQCYWFVLMVFMDLSPLRTFMIKGITISKVNHIFLKNLLQPQVLSSGSTQNKASSVLCSSTSAKASSAYPFLASFQLHIPALSSNSWSSIWSSALFWL